MQSIKRILPILCLFMFSSAFGQDEFYNDKSKKEKKKEKLEVVDEKLVSFTEYSTEIDYNQSKRKTVDPDQVHQEDDWEEEIYQDEDERKRYRDNRAGEIAAQVIFEVVINTVFIIATFWH